MLSNLSQPERSKEEMIQEDLLNREIKNPLVIDAFRKVDRVKFVGNLNIEKAHNDSALPVDCNQTISQPYMVGYMLESLDLKGGEKILEIGTGTGYQTALLAEIASEVWTVERIEHLATHAEDLLDSMDYQNIHYKLGDGTLGFPEGQPFDRIIVSAAGPKIPQALLAQLATNGLLAIPVGPRDVQELLVIKNENGTFKKAKLGSCRFVPLIGKDGIDINKRDA